MVLDADLFVLAQHVINALQSRPDVVIHRRAVV